MKNMKKSKNSVIIFALVLIIAALILSSGCSAAMPQMFNNSKSYDSVADEIGWDYYDDYDYKFEFYDSGGLENETESYYNSYSMLSGDSGTSSEVNLPADRKIIRDASIIMEVEDVEQSYDNMLMLLTKYGGYEARRDMRNNSNGYPTVGATLKIPADKLDAFLAEIKKEGETISSNISSSDITDEYYDSKIRLTTKEKTLENYYVLLENAPDVDEQLRVMRYINDITEEIEQLKGSIKRWDSLVEYSTVTLDLYRPYEAPMPEPEPREIHWDSLTLDDMGWYISSGFLGVINVIFSVLQWIIISLAIISPVLIPGLIVLFVLLRRRKKNQKTKSHNQDQQQNNITDDSK